MSNENYPIPLADGIDRLVNRIGVAISWVYALLVAVIIVQVVLRYGFSRGLVVLEEIQWHFYALGVMFGLAYGQVHNVHIRVDLIHMRLSSRGKHLIEIFGIVLLLLPFIAVVGWHSIDFVADSWRINEHSAAPTGLPWRWAIKAVIPISFGLLLLSTLSRLMREVVLLARGH